MMQQRADVLNGAYCPVPSAHIMAVRLKNGVYAMTECGLEKRCSKCRDYWPADTEFYYVAPSKEGGIGDWCKACFDAWKREHNAKMKAAA